MRILIRTIERQATGASVAADRLIESDALTLGRATDQNLQSNDPRIALQHARLVRSGGELLVSCVAPAQIEVNGRLQRDAVLRIGDDILLGPLHIRLIEPPAGVDVALTVEHDERPAPAAEQAGLPPFKMTLAAVGWRKRPWAWIGIAAALLLGLVLPWFLLGRGDASIAWLRQGVLPSDMQWTSGPLHSAHGSLEMECEACHVQPFRRVRNEACLDCHAPALHQHLPADHPATPAMAADRCTSCHVEHDEPSNLIQTDSRLCTDCHAAPLDHGANAGALSVTDFSSAHPDFRVSLLKAPDFKVERLRLGEAKLIESSNLEFTHAAHLVAGGIKAPQGKVVMQCSDCHTPQPGGAAFEPINMERHCSSCHTLGFDPAEPDRKLPHGDPKLVMQTLLDHYSRRYLDGYSDAGISAVRSAPPGASMSSAGRARALGGARERAMKVAEDIFERRVCADCHTVSRLGTAGATEWVVAPVKLTQTFMPKAQFDHAAHATSESACTDCHAATESKTAADVLMPGIAVCRDCHGGESGTEGKVARVPSPCASCHVFHDNNEPLWVPLMQKTLRQAAAKQ